MSQVICAFVCQLSCDLRGAMPRPRVAKKHLKVSRDPYKKMSCEEVRLARMWHTEDHMEPCEIAGLLLRDTSTMTRLLLL